MLGTRFWKKYFEVYDHLNVLYPYQDLISAIIEHLQVKEGDRILDAGSGTGNLSIALTKKGALVTGFDFSDEGIKRHKSKHPAANIVHGDLTQPLPFHDNYFDKIASNNVLYTLPKEQNFLVLKELHRILKPGGIIVVSNIAEGFNPVRIYISHFRKSVTENGLFGTLLMAVKLLIPTLQIFYYNYLINRENSHRSYSFVKSKEQSGQLIRAGFNNVSEDKRTYAQQAILNFAKK